MDYATRLRLLRTARGMSQDDLATISGVPRYDLSKIETGRMLPNPEWDRDLRQSVGWTAQVDTALDALAEALLQERAEAAPCTETAA